MIESDKTVTRNPIPEPVCPDACISREPGNFPHMGYYGWPSVAVDENGVTYVVVSKRLLHVDPYGRVMLYKSYDRGLTWDGGVCIFDTILDDRDAGIVYMGGGRMLVTTFSHDAPLYRTNRDRFWTRWQDEAGPAGSKKVFDVWDVSTAADKTGCSSYIISDDYGQTWSDRRLMPVTAPHGPSLMKDGTLLYLGVPKAPEFATGRGLPEGVWCFVSSDRGNTFTPRSSVKIDPSLKPCEAFGIQLDDGSIVATVRTGSFETYAFRSYDGGFTWTEAERVTYGAPAHLTQTPDGLVVMSYGRRKNPTGLCVRFSSDRGLSWGEEHFISRPLSPDDNDLGYPATARYPDGTFITVSYRKWENDRKPSLVRSLWRIREES